MKMRFALAALPLLLAACQPAPVVQQPDLAQEWKLVGFSAGALPPRVTMDLREPGRAAGQGPCNRWFGEVQGSFPAFRLPMVATTQMACPDLAAEGRFHDALGRVTAAELVGDQLVLTGPKGLRLTFAPQG
ncbi:MAG TPA: META domain-containing protein [Gemmobacter sp.]|nr:META domain-containing protein [Gemmobacter sp.]